MLYAFVSRNYPCEPNARMLASCMKRRLKRWPVAARSERPLPPKHYGTHMAAHNFQNSAIINPSRAAITLVMTCGTNGGADTSLGGLSEQAHLAREAAGAVFSHWRGRGGCLRESEDGKGRQSWAALLSCLHLGVTQVMVRFRRKIVSIVMMMMQSSFLAMNRQSVPPTDSETSVKGIFFF